MVAPLEPVLFRTFLAICDAGSFTACRRNLGATVAAALME